MLIGGDLITGTVGIGTVEPDSFVSGGMVTYTNTKLVVVGKILANSYTSFTGAHRINLECNPLNLIEGMIMSSTGNVVLQDINNTIPYVIPSYKTNDKTIFGVYSGYENTTTTSNISNISNISNTTSTISIISSNYYVNSLGEGGILVSNYSGEIQNGDYITSSPIPGYGSLQTDDILHSYTVAKCTQNIDWTSITENIICPIDGKMYKSLLIACTYHCG